MLREMLPTCPRKYSGTCSGVPRTPTSDRAGAGRCWERARAPSVEKRQSISGQLLAKCLGRSPVNRATPLGINPKSQSWSAFGPGGAFGRASGLRWGELRSSSLLCICGVVSMEAKALPALDRSSLLGERIEAKDSPDGLRPCLWPSSAAAALLGRCASSRSPAGRKEPNLVAAACAPAAALEARAFSSATRSPAAVCRRLSTLPSAALAAASLLDDCCAEEETPPAAVSCRAFRWFYRACSSLVRGDTF